MATRSKRNSKSTSAREKSSHGFHTFLGPAISGRLSNSRVPALMRPSVTNVILAVIAPIISIASAAQMVYRAENRAGRKSPINIRRLPTRSISAGWTAELARGETARLQSTAPVAYATNEIKKTKMYRISKPTFHQSQQKTGKNTSAFFRSLFESQLVKIYDSGLDQI
jgi:hypothetical protein